MQFEIIDLVLKGNYWRFSLRFYFDLKQEIEVKGCRYFEAQADKTAKFYSPAVPSGGGKFFNILAMTKELKEKVIVEVAREVAILRGEGDT